MIVRTLVTVAYLLAVVAALALQFVFPVIALYLIYALLAWFIASLFVYRLPVMARTLGRPTSTPPGYSAVATPSPVVAGAGPVVTEAGGSTLDFCPFCAAAVEPGTPVCPECHHRIPAF